MICLDSSALLAIVLNEPQGPACREALRGRTDLFISAGTLAEGLIVAGGRGVATELSELLEVAQVDVFDLDKSAAIRAAAVYAKWGKGYHPARLNYGDCFAYELASRMNCPLLYVGDDFAKTDIQSAL